MKTTPLLRVPTTSPIPSLPPVSRPKASPLERSTQWAFNFYITMVVVAILYFILLPFFL